MSKDHWGTLITFLFILGCVVWFFVLNRYKERDMWPRE